MTEARWLSPVCERFRLGLGAVLAVVNAPLLVGVVYELTLGGQSLWPWVVRAVAFSALLTGVMLAGWFLHRRTRWLVTESGIEIQRRRARPRFLAWAEVRSLRVKPFGLTIRAAARPRVEAIYYLPPREAAWVCQVYRATHSP